MDRTRTIYKLRKFKNEILFSILSLTLGIGVFCFICAFESGIISVIQTNVIKISAEEIIPQVNNNTMDVSYKIFNVFEKSSIYTFLFAMEGFMMILFFVRMSSSTPKFAKISPAILNIGALILFIYYILVGFSSISNGIFSVVEFDRYLFLKIIGIVFILIANITFIYQVFNQIVLEKDFY